MIDLTTWIQNFTGNTSTKNSKGLVISQVIDQHVKWACIIIYVCFKSLGQEFDVNPNMSETIGQIVEQGKVFNWFEHIFNILRTICE
jgi:hypothetical protein